MPSGGRKAYKVFPSTPPRLPPPSYSKRSYQDLASGSGRHEEARPSTSAYRRPGVGEHGGPLGTDARPPMRERPSTSAGELSGRENLSMYLERMEKILAEVQATHSDLIKRRERKSQAKAPQSETPEHPRKPKVEKRNSTREIRTVPIDLSEILLTTASPEPEQRAPPRSSGRHASREADAPRAHPKPRRREHSAASHAPKTAQPVVARRDDAPPRPSSASAADQDRSGTSGGGTSSRRFKALRKLRSVSARNRTQRAASSLASASGSHPAEGKENADLSNAQRASPTIGGDDSPVQVLDRGIIAVTSSTFCVAKKPDAIPAPPRRPLPAQPPPPSLETKAQIPGASHEAAPNAPLPRQARGGGTTTRNASGGEASAGRDVRGGRVGATPEGAGGTEATAAPLDPRVARLGAYLKGGLVRRRLRSRPARDCISDIGHLRDLIANFSAPETSPAARQSEATMRAQCLKDLRGKKANLVAILTTSRPPVRKKKPPPTSHPAPNTRERPATAPIRGRNAAAARMARARAATQDVRDAVPEPPPAPPPPRTSFPSVDCFGRMKKSSPLDKGRTKGKKDRRSKQKKGKGGYGYNN